MTIGDAALALLFAVLAGGGGFILTRAVEVLAAVWRRKGAETK